MSADTRPEWALVTVTEDLMAASRDLAQLAWEFGQEARGWTVPEGREALLACQRQVTDWAQLAALDSARGDYWTRLDALHGAQHRVAAATVSLRRWWERGQLWNTHRMRAVPASIARELEQ